MSVQQKGTGPCEMLMIVGTGRSGTHFLTRSLIEHPMITDFTGGKENRRVFSYVTQAALSNSRKLPLNVSMYYHLYNTLSGKRVFLDQTHSNLFFIEKLTKKFPQAKFVAMWRDTKAVVASMLKHPGTRGWCENYKSYPFPNQFLGRIDVEAYDKMSLVERCALRVVRHKNEINDVSSRFPSIIYIQSYDRLVHQYKFERSQLLEWIGLEAAMRSSIVADGASLKKWQSVLTDRDLELIENIEARYCRYDRAFDVEMATSDDDAQKET